ncbi:MAG: polyprenyl synthetase family protein [Sedimentisphaerales bacterium]|nr:polyprenyl synthetase family protein [Sedimentisphaerales bacterium]
MSDNTHSRTLPGRGPQENIPQQKDHRDRLIAFVRDYVSQMRLTPPLSLEELRRHSVAVVQRAGLTQKYMDFTAVLVNNETWRPVVAAIPYSRRLLLLPNCLRDKEYCAGHFDELGLVCGGCGRCMIQELQSQAEQLGYAVLVAEGSPVVMSMIESGQIEAVIGVSCLGVLEKTFPYMEAGAVPGLAVPLLYDGCVNTTLDTDWLWEAIYLNTDSEAHWLDVDELRERVSAAFSRSSLQAVLGSCSNHVEQLALEWLGGEGKRWRPFLTAGVYRALLGRSEEFDERLVRTMVSVECFHKASLIHDDIEDDDSRRYGKETVHQQYGVPIALNVGDHLLGEGYRLLSELDVSDSVKVKMLRIAALGHRQLCVGQGAELAWIRAPKVLRVDEVLDIFQRKTSPAFEVALRLGAILAGADGKLGEVLTRYSDALGIAYQIRDDLDDTSSGEEPGDLAAGRPSILAALAWERADEPDRKWIEQCWFHKAEPSVLRRATELFEQLSAPAEAMALLERYKGEALRCLEELDNAVLKGLLRRVVCKVFNDIERLKCCDEYTSGHDLDGGTGAGSSG